jgi:hypothetical protein
MKVCVVKKEKTIKKNQLKRVFERRKMCKRKCVKEKLN